jgi:hypothetical protein
MKSTLLEYYKQKYKVGGKKVPVKSTGMWYQNGDVVVPSNNITMKGPNGEPDYFKKPILGTGINTGQTQVMQPGKDYTFPNDNAVLEKKMQKGAVTKSRGLTSMIPQLTPVVNDVLDFTDIVQGAYSGNRTQMNQGIIGMASPGLAGKALPTLLDYATEKTLGNKVADTNQNKREGIVNMSTSDLQKLYTKYGPGGYDKWEKSGFPKLQVGGEYTSAPDELTQGINPLYTYRGMTSNYNQNLNQYLSKAKQEQERFGYTAEPKAATNQSAFPKGVEVNSQVLRLAQALQDIPESEQMDYARDMSADVAEAFRSPIEYKLNKNLKNKLGKVNLSGSLRDPKKSEVNYQADLNIPKGLGTFNASGKLFDPKNPQINYKANLNIPQNLGNLNFSGVYDPNKSNSLESLYQNMNYNVPIGMGSMNLSPKQQSLNLKTNPSNSQNALELNYNRISSKEGFNADPAEQSLRLKSGKNSLSYKRKLSDSEKLNELTLQTQILPELGFTAGARYSTPTDARLDPLSANIPAYVANAGIQGTKGPVNYNVSGTYNPDTGYTYQGKGDVNLLNKALKISGGVSGNQQSGMSQYDLAAKLNLFGGNINMSGKLAGNQKNALDTYGVEAKAKLNKNLELNASYNKSKSNEPGKFSAGLTYNKFFEEGGEVDDHEDDKEMVEGIADILRRVRDKENRKQIANKMLSDFEEEDVQYNADDFMKAAKIMQMGGMSIPGVNGSVVGSTVGSVRETYKNKKKK